jgi:hypothetical protein
MNTAAPVQLIASDNPLCFTPEAGMASCCLDAARTLAPTGANALGALQTSGSGANGSARNPRQAQSGELRPAEIHCLTVQKTAP